MIQVVMFEVMRYFGLNHRPSSGMKWKLNELRGTYKSYFNGIFSKFLYQFFIEFGICRDLTLSKHECTLFI